MDLLLYVPHSTVGERRPGRHRASRGCRLVKDNGGDRRTSENALGVDLWSLASLIAKRGSEKFTDFLLALARYRVIVHVNDAPLFHAQEVSRLRRP